jgi:hypothetical protein
MSLLIQVLIAVIAATVIWSLIRHLDPSKQPQDEPEQLQKDNDFDEGQLFSVKVELAFDYTDAEGRKSKRHLDVKNMEVKTDWIFIWGYCHSKEDYRTFNVSRVKNCVDVETGEMITDVASYLMEKHHQQYEAYKSSVYYTIDQFIEKESDLLMVLFYVCKADGRFSAAEKTVLVDLLITLTGDNRITAEEIKNIFKYEKSPSKTDFEMMTLNLSNKDIVKKQLVLQAAKDIINTQKQVSEDEQYALNYLEKNLKLDI